MRGNEGDESCETEADPFVAPDDGEEKELVD